MKLALIGFGVVGQGFARILLDKHAELQDLSFDAQIVAVATRSRGALYRPDGLDIADLLDTIGQGDLRHYPDAPGLERDWNAERIVRESSADAIIEVSPTNLQTAQPALDLFRLAFEHSKHVITANKGPIALAYADLKERAGRAHRTLGIEATVMAGTPSLRLALESLQGCRIKEARGIVNGTTNYILTQMEGGMDYADALAQAQQLGYAEPDPTADVEGWDAASKVLILSTVLFGKRLTMDDLDVRGISSITAADVRDAAAAGERWKLIARVTPEGGSVQPTRLPLTDPLAGVANATNAITYDTDLVGPVTLIGAGAGAQQTGFGLLSDLLAIHRAGH